MTDGPAVCFRFGCFTGILLYCMGMNREHCSDAPAPVRIFADLPCLGQENWPIAPATRYRIGGPARIALFPRTTTELEAAWEWAVRQPLPRLVLGGGSNVLVSDAGFPGVVLVTTELLGIQDLGQDRYRVAAGEPLDRLVREVMLLRNYSGVGALTGIPGTVGGAIFMNAGTVNGAICDFLDSVLVFGPEGPRRIPMDAVLYGYRHQKFLRPDEVIAEGDFRFAPAETDQRTIYDHYIRRRREKQPEGWCCGSVFKNPAGDHAGRLIEACGLKGTRYGGAVISPLHANFIMNEQSACFEDVLYLIRLARRAVQERFGIVLEPEVRIIGASEAL